MIKAIIFAISLVLVLIVFVFYLGFRDWCRTFEYKDAPYPAICNSFGIYERRNE